MPKSLTSIAVADDHTLFRKAMNDFLSKQRNMEVVIEASNGAELMEELKNYPVDILITDICMPRLSGDELIKMVRTNYPDIKVIVLSMHTDLHKINELIALGIQAYISKSDEPEQLLEAIITVSENRVYKNKLFTDVLYWHAQTGSKSQSRTAITLEEREKKILQSLWEEKSNEEIADEVFLGVRSIEKIRQSMKEKLGVKSTIGLLKYGLDNNIIRADAARAH
jgi:DNA-binding NarL/FixJ family response regulator